MPAETKKNTNWNRRTRTRLQADMVEAEEEVQLDEVAVEESKQAIIDRYKAHREAHFFFFRFHHVRL